MMTARVETFDFDIQPSTTHVSRNILPDGEAEVTFQVRNSSDCPKRAEMILEPISGPMGSGNTENLADWLQLVEPPEFDYQPQSHRNYTARIKVTGYVVPGTYSFRLLVVGHDDPDHEYLASDEVSFNVAVPPINIRPFLIGGGVLLVLITIGVILALLFGKPPSGLKITLEVPEKANVGQPAEYKLLLENLDGTTAENVVMEYAYPEGILDSWANVESTTDSPVIAHCGSTDELLRCVVERIGPKQTVKLMIYALPGPMYPEPDASTPTATASPSSPIETPTAQVRQIDNKGKFTLHWMENGTHQEDLDLAVDHPITILSPVNNVKEVPVSGAAIPAVNIASVGLPVNISLVGWSNTGEGGPVFLEYKLPPGMRFASYPTGSDLGQCEHPEYSILHCKASSLDPIDIQVVALQPSTGYAQILGGKENDEENEPYPELITAKKVPLLPAANNQLVFNGTDEWAQLGYSGLPDTKEFTVEMWVNPYSLEDEQALIGAHRHNQEKKTVDNLFLVGYYNGSINVNVLGDYHNLDLIKTAGSFHLAIVVNTQRDLPLVTAYKDGLPVYWDGCTVEGVQTGNTGEDTKKDSKWEHCLFSNRFEKTAIEDRINVTYLDWVLGQDWDPNGSGIIPSDFFRGAISDVRIYARGLTNEEVKEDMYLPPALCKPGEDNCDPQDLIGWWSLAQPNQSTVAQQAECILPKLGKLTTETATPQISELKADGLVDACELVDLGPNHNNGARSGGSWENKNASFGDALAFDGSNTVNLGSVLLSNFTENTTEVGATATPGIKGVPVTISAWVYIDTVPSQQQTILANSFTLGAEKARVRLSIASDGHVQAIYEKLGSEAISVKDDRAIHAGQWVHYAVIFWFDMETGELVQNDKTKLLYLFRDGQRVKTTLTFTFTPTVTNALTTPPPSSNLALNKPATASGSCSTKEEPAKAVNGSWTGDLYQKWCDDSTSTSKWWQVDLGANFNINKFIVRHAGAGGEPEIWNTRDFSIQVSTDGVNWTTVQEVKGNRESITTHDVATTTARYVRLEVITPTRVENMAARIYEVEVYGTGIPVGLHLGGLRTVVNGIVEVVEGFTGRIDEVRIWNRALYDTNNNTSHISPEIDLWRRLPGVAFDEYVYWSFDDRASIDKDCQKQESDPTDPTRRFFLCINGPAWVPNDLSIDYTE